MKERYFTTDNLQAKAAEQLARIEGIKKTRPLIKKKTALLVLDMQEYFLDPDSHAFVPSALAILPQIQKLIAAFKHQHQPVIFTQHINTPENAAAMSRWWRDLITAENPSSKISSELETKSYPVLQKTQYDAFYQTPLEDMLRNLDIAQVIITGVMTHLCCETTARSAFVRGFDVFFAVDGTATYHEEFHLASLQNLAHGFATLVLTNDVTAELLKDED